MAEEPRYLAPFRQRDFQISCAAVSFVMTLLLMCLFAALLLRSGGDDDDNEGSFVERIANTPTAFDQQTAVGVLSSPTPTAFQAAATLVPTPTPLVLAPVGGFFSGGFPTPVPIPNDPYVPPAQPPVVVIVPTNPPPVVIITEAPPPTLIPTNPPPPVDSPADEDQGFRIVIRTQDGDSLFLINRTSDRAFPLAPLRLGDGDGAIQGSDWEVERLEPGVCVTVWKNDDDDAKAPDVDCDIAGKKLKRKGSDRFWREDFNVYYNEALIAVCTEDRCSITIPE